MSETQWIVQRKNKSYQIKNLESLFVYSLAFDLKFEEISKAVLQMNSKGHDFAEFEFGRLKISGVK